MAKDCWACCPPWKGTTTGKAPEDDGDDRRRVAIPAAGCDSFVSIVVHSSYCVMAFLERTCINVIWDFEGSTPYNTAQRP